MYMYYNNQYHTQLICGHFSSLSMAHRAIPIIAFIFQLCYQSYVVISDCLHHDTVAVYLFQKSLIAFLKTRFPSHLQNIYYFSDGAVSQYKNRKNFINLCYHEEDMDFLLNGIFLQPLMVKVLATNLVAQSSILLQELACKGPMMNSL